MTNKYRSLKEIVEALPVSNGDVLWVAADLTRLAIAIKRKEGSFSADELIDLLQQKTGAQGTLLIPSFNHNLKRNGSFNIKKTRPVTGALSIVAFGRNDFIRTRHPLHSFMVWGKYSGKLAGLQNISSFGSDSPFDFLLKNKARALLIGTTVAEAFTFTHFVEEQRQVKYRRYKTYRIDYAGEDGTAQKQEFVLYAKKSGWTMCLDRLENLLDEKGMIRREIYNGVGFSTIELSDAYEIISEDIRDNKARNIACFNMSLYLKDNIKRVLGKFFGYRTVSERLRG